ncbi:hypothetical protein M0804_015276 [Polistes exclamans]|nr:hypothetical protein M0804_015277 [Polistes exclamans]KAI4473584.1 hypothetical protein M0804_015276 [Polistes exclamans]
MGGGGGGGSSRSCGACVLVQTTIVSSYFRSCIRLTQPSHSLSRICDTLSSFRHPDLGSDIDQDRTSLRNPMQIQNREAFVIGRLLCSMRLT